MVVCSDSEDTRCERKKGVSHAYNADYHVDRSYCPGASWDHRGRGALLCLTWHGPSGNEPHTLTLRTGSPVRGCEVQHRLRIVYDRTDRIPRAGIGARWDCLGITLHTWHDVGSALAGFYLRCSRTGNALAVRPRLCPAHC